MHSPGRCRAMHAFAFDRCHCDSRVIHTGGDGAEPRANSVRPNTGLIPDGKPGRTKVLMLLQLLVVVAMAARLLRLVHSVLLS